MEYGTVILNSLIEMKVAVVGFLPTLVNLIIALAILVVGWFVAKLVTKGLIAGLRVIHFDKVLDKMGLSKVLKAGGVKQKPSNMLGCIFYWVLIVTVLMSTVKTLGLTITTDFLDAIFAYIPHVVTGALTLIVGMIVARVVSGLVYFAAKSTEMPIPETLRDLSKMAIVVYVTIMYLKEIGFVSLFEGPHYGTFITGIIFALALAFGLAGKDIAAKYLEVVKKPEHHHK